MKLFDPFAGYRLASGHPFFHIALFTVSWFVNILGDRDSSNDGDILSAFLLLRWGHFTLFTLAMIEVWVSQPSKIPERSEDEETKEEDEIARLKIQHRDSTCKLFARILATLSVFGYQGCVFYAQLVLGHDLLKQDGDGHYTLQPIVGNETMWLCIEAACFYLYVVAAMAFLFARQMRGVFESACTTEDMYKAVTDYIIYSSYNLTWFALNFVTCCMPPLCIFGLEGHKYLEGQRKTFLPIMYTLWAMHILCFALQTRIYEYSEPKKAWTAPPSLIASFDKDDEFKQQKT